MFEDELTVAKESLQGLGSAREGVRRRGGTADEPELTRVLEAVEGVRRAADALELSVIGQVSRWDEERGPDGIFRPMHRPLGHVADMAPDAVAVATSLGVSAAYTRCHLAARAETDLAELADLVARGTLREYAMGVVARETKEASREAVAAVVQHMLAPMRGRAGSVRIEHLEPREISRACRRILKRVQPEVLAERSRRNRKEQLDVRVGPGPVGTSDLSATLPSEVAAVLKAAIDEAGALRRESDPDMTAGAARAWGLADLALRGVDVRAEVRLGVPVITSAASRLGFAPMGGGECPAPAAGGEGSGHRGEAFGLREERIVTGSGADPVDVLPEEWAGEGISSQVPTTFGPGGPHGWVGGCEIPGVGYVPPDAVAAITTNLEVQVSRALLDARTGTLVETSNPRYVIPDSLRDFVAARDGTCRMWGCNRRVRPEKLEHPTDIDHAEPWPAGATSPGNLSALCRHHHRVKHTPRWSHILHPDGTTEWISPGGVPAMTFPDHTVHTDEDEERFEAPTRNVGPTSSHLSDRAAPDSPPAVGASELVEAFAGPPPF